MPDVRAKGGGAELSVVAVLASIIAVACGTPGWTVYVAGPGDNTYFVRLSVDGVVTDHRIGPGADNENFALIYSSPRVPTTAFAVILDAQNCQPIDRLDPLPREHLQVRIEHDGAASVSTADADWMADSTGNLPTAKPSEPCVPAD